MRLFPQAVEAVKNGSVLVVDQLDASINPMAIMSLINIFHNDEINKNGAQLIFATCNPIYLNPNLFRRDEIKFVNKEDGSGSTIYSLSDFGTEGEGGVKTTDDTPPTTLWIVMEPCLELTLLRFFANLLRISIGGKNIPPFDSKFS